MRIDSKKLPALLDRLSQHNDAKHARLNREYGLNSSAAYKQIIEPPVPLDNGIPTLMPRIYAQSSEMLTIRFEYASSWKDAILGNRLLSINEMEAIWSNSEIKQQVQSRALYFDSSPPAREPWDRVTLFGINQADNEEIYLIWSGHIEPEVVSYIGNYEERFDNIADFILFFCQE